MKTKCAKRNYGLGVKEKINVFVLRFLTRFVSTFFRDLLWFVIRLNKWLLYFHCVGEDVQTIG